MKKGDYRMVQDSVINIVNKAIIANNSNNYKYEHEIITHLKKSIQDNNKLFKITNSIDIKNNNGFMLDNTIIDNIFKKYDNVPPLIISKNKISILKNQLINSKIYSKLGIILVIFDGNTYTMLELILLGILTHNTIIFTSEGYMGGTNELLMNIIQSILEKNNLKKEMFQHSLTIRSNEFFKNFKSINNTIIIGDNDFINKYIKECTTPTILSGYKNYDLYIESLKDIDFIKKIISKFTNINIYVKNSLNVKIDNAIYVEDIDEVITYINYDGSNYSSSIFTENKGNAAKFLERVNSKNIFVNASPTLESNLDIKQEDLLREKNIILPDIFKINATIIDKR